LNFRLKSEETVTGVARYCASLALHGRAPLDFHGRPIVREASMEPTTEGRVRELEKLVSQLRHDLRGAITPAALVADRLRQNAEPGVQRAGATVAAVVERVLAILDATRPAVPSRGDLTAGPMLGARK
jgi:hypothetical protein